jgi:hypothetical protein
MAKKERRAATAGTGARAPWRIHFFQRHVQSDPTQSVPARDFLDRCPSAVTAKLVAVVKAVADAPPPAFSGGGKWRRCTAI